MNNHEVAIQNAIRDLISGVYTSQRSAAKAWGIPRSTLQDRMKGRRPHKIAHQQQQRLTPDQEEFLVEWIIDEDSRAQPPSHQRVREMAIRILKSNGDRCPLGHKWVENFLHRQPRVSSVVGRSIETSRAGAAGSEAIQAFLELFERTVKRLDIQADDIWNMDETGIALGVCTNTRVLARAGKKKAYIKEPGNREWVSIIECISASGSKLKPMVVFKGKSLQTTWFPSNSIPDWLYTTSQNGWTSNSIGLAWINSIFIPDTASPEGRNRLLILDGHGSHIDIEFIWACKGANIHLLFLPAHTSHVLQPLDLAPFSVIKSKYRKQIQELSSLDDAAPVKKERFVTCYHQARTEGFSERVIRAGWRATGMVPFNPDQVLLSSQVSGRPSTPPKVITPQSPSQIIFKTPQKQQDLYQAQQILLRSGYLPRSARALITKAGKAISRTNSQTALLETKVQSLQTQLNQLTDHTTKKRKRVDPNERFHNAESIRAEMIKAAEEVAKSSTKTTQKIARAVSKSVLDKTLESMCTQFQI